MNKIIHKTKAFVFSQQRSIFSSALMLAFMIIIARLFGFLRYRTLAGYFTKEELDIFFASFRIPDLVFEVLITGALTSSFIPIFIKFQKNKEELNINISSIINLVMIAMIVFVLIILIFLEPIIFFITPGFSTEKNLMVIQYSRLLLIGQLPFLVSGNILTGIGQANKMFFLTSLSPIVYNVAIIASTILFAQSLHLTAPLVGVIAGAILFLIIQIPLFFKSGTTYSFILKKTKGLIEFIRMVIPRITTVLVAQIDATIDLTLATLLGAGSYTIFYFAQHFQLFPVSVIGIAFGQASLPYLSEMFQNNKIEEFKKILVDSILNLFFFTIPIACFFIFARTPLIRLFFGGEKFDWTATVQTAITLSYFALSIPLHSIYYFITRCFYAFLDSRTPFYVSFVSILINTILSVIFILVLHLPIWSLALSFSFSMIINSSILLLIFYYKIGGFDVRLLFSETTKILIASGIASIINYYIAKLLDGLIFDTTRTINVFFLLATLGIIFVVLYLFLSWLMNIREIYLITKLLTKAKEYQKRILEFNSSYD